MTLPDLFLLLAVFLMPFSPQPKKGKKPRKPKRLLAVRGNLRRRALYMRWREPTPEQRARAEQFRRENLARPTPAIEALTAVLREMRIEHRLEEPIWYDGDLVVFVDVWLPNLRLGIEADGDQHRFQRRYDIQKDRMVAEVTGGHVYRNWNRWFLAPNLHERLIEILK